MSSANVSFKIIYNGEIRRFTKPKPSFEQFNSIIRSLLGTSYPSLRVCYRDEEGDVISVSSELEWQSALEYLSKDRLVRFVLYDRSVNPTVSFFQKAEMGAASVLGSQLESRKEVNPTKEEAEERKNKFLRSLEDCRPKTNLADSNRKQSKEEEEKKKVAEEIQKILAEEFKETEKEKKEIEEQAKKEAEEERSKREAEEQAMKEAELQKELENLRLLKLREQEEQDAQEQRRLLEEKRKQEDEEVERKRQEDLIKKALAEEEEKMRQKVAEENKKKDSLLSALTEEWETLGQHFERDPEGDKKKQQDEESLMKKTEAEEHERAALLAQYKNELEFLREMGFSERERNLALLKKHTGSVALVLDELVSVP